MICSNRSRGTLAENLMELISEYGALKDEQLKKYFSLEDALLEKTVRKLTKKGRVVYDREKGCIKVPGNHGCDESLIHCFWLVIDLKDEIEFHAVGKYPLFIAMYADSQVYEVYYCKKGDEVALAHAIERLKESFEGKVLIVVEEIWQIHKLDVENIIFCTISEKGEVKYFE